MLRNSLLIAVFSVGGESVPNRNFLYTARYFFYRTGEVHIYIRGNTMEEYGLNSCLNCFKDQ